MPINTQKLESAALSITVFSNQILDLHFTRPPDREVMQDLQRLGTAYRLHPQSNCCYMMQYPKTVDGLALALEIKRAFLEDHGLTVLVLRHGEIVVEAETP